MGPGKWFLQYIIKYQTYGGIDMAIYQGEQIVTQGTPGKTAYQSAVEAGYTGTEEEFNTALANVGTMPVQIKKW